MCRDAPLGRLFPYGIERRARGTSPSNTTCILDAPTVRLYSPYLIQIINSLECRQAVEYLTPPSPYKGEGERRRLQRRARGTSLQQNQPRLDVGAGISAVSPQCYTSPLTPSLIRRGREKNGLDSVGCHGCCIAARGSHCGSVKILHCRSARGCYNGLCSTCFKVFTNTINDGHGKNSTSRIK